MIWTEERRAAASADMIGRLARLKAARNRLQKIVMRTHLYPFDRVVLEAIDLVGEVRYWELPDLSGYSNSTCGTATHKLKLHGLVMKSAGRMRITERGKITLAIIRGKEQRARLALRRAA